MLFAGYDTYKGHFSVPEIIIVGVAADLAGATIAYAIGYFGMIELVARHGAQVHITPERLARAEHWFARHGATAVPISRVLPLVRAYTSFPAGAARMPYASSSLLSLLGGLPWIGCWGLLGRELGPSYHSVQNTCTTSIIVALVLIVAVDRVSRYTGGVTRRGSRRPREPSSRCGAPVALGLLHGPAEAAARLLVGAHHARSVAARLGLGGRSTRRRASASKSRCTPASLVGLVVMHAGARGDHRSGGGCGVVVLASRARRARPGVLAADAIERRLGKAGRAIARGCLAAASRWRSPTALGGPRATRWKTPASLDGLRSAWRRRSR